MNLQLGKKYRLPHGVGTLMYRENFDKDGQAVKSEDLGEWTNQVRYIFEIEPCYWTRIMQTNSYAAWGDQIQEYENANQLT